MIRMGAADSPSVSSIFVCQPLILYQSVAKVSHIGHSYTKVYQSYPNVYLMGPLGLSAYPFGWWCIPLHLQHKKKGSPVTSCRT